MTVTDGTDSGSCFELLLFNELPYQVDVLVFSLHRNVVLLFAVVIEVTEDNVETQTVATNLLLVKL